MPAVTALPRFVVLTGSPQAATRCHPWFSPLLVRGGGVRVSRHSLREGRSPGFVASFAPLLFAEERGQDPPAQPARQRPGSEPVQGVQPTRSAGRELRREGGGFSR